MSEDELNLSNAPTKTLLRMQSKFYAKSAINDLTECLKTLNFGLIRYYVRCHLDPKILVYTLDSLMKRLVDKFGFKRSLRSAQLNSSSNSNASSAHKSYGNFDGSLGQLGFDKVVMPSSIENSEKVLESER